MVVVEEVVANEVEEVVDGDTTVEVEAGPEGSSPDASEDGEDWEADECARCAAGGGGGGGGGCGEGDRPVVAVDSEPELTIPTGSAAAELDAENEPLPSAVVVVAVDDDDDDDDDDDVVVAVAAAAALLLPLAPLEMTMLDEVAVFGALAGHTSMCSSGASLARFSEQGPILCCLSGCFHNRSPCTPALNVPCSLKSITFAQPSNTSLVTLFLFVLPYSTRANTATLRRASRGKSHTRNGQIISSLNTGFVSNAKKLLIVFTYRAFLPYETDVVANMFTRKVA